METILLKNVNPDISLLSSLLRAFEAKVTKRFRCISKDCLGDLTLIAEEILVNIISYAFPCNKDAEKKIFFSCSFESDTKALILKFVDNGCYYDVSKQTDPDLDIPLQARAKGGLGVYFVRQLSNKLLYKRLNNENIVEIHKRMDANIA